MSTRRISPTTVAHALGEWQTFDGPLFRRLARGIAAAIERGDLPEGGVLPADRRLATGLAVSRGTVVAAYELLRRDGVVARRHGSGTWISPTAPAAATVADDVTARSGRLTGRMVDGRGDVIDLGVSILPDAAALPPHALSFDSADLERISGRHGYQPAGLRALRHRIAELHCDHGLPTDADQVVVTAGAQQAIDLTARMLVTPGATVVVDRPTYPGALELYARVGARLIGVDVDGAGVRVEELLEVTTREKPALIYVVASCHNPTGTVMPEGRRRLLAEIADRGTVVVDDASLAHLSFGASPRPVAAFAASGAPAITVGSLSKLLWGGLRVGWLRAPAPLAARLARLKAATDIGSSVVSQVVALRALDDHDDIVEKLRDRHREHARLLCKSLAEELPAWRFAEPAGGLSLWVQLPSGSADGFAPVAARHGVVFLPGAATSVDDGHPHHLRLSFALPPDRLTEGVRRLSSAWAEYSSDDLGAPPRAVAG